MRRNRLDLMKPAELAIHNAADEIEKIGADVRLTNAINKLWEAKELVSDFIDETDGEEEDGEGGGIDRPKDPPKNP